MHKRTWIVKPRGRRWAVQRMDANNADSLHDTQASAIARGDDMAQRARGALHIKGTDGRIVEKRLFSGD